MKRAFFFNIDVIGACNLRCPSCPTGNYQERVNPSGLMSPERLVQIMDKAVSECQVTGVGLFNWNEPVLHPQLPKLVEIVQEQDVPCRLSSNMNNFRKMDEVLAANPASLRISNSGFTQSIYGRYHRGGDIELVKRNMRELAAAKRRTDATTEIEVLYHRYKDNLRDEAPMRDFALELGFGFRPVWAFMMPLEKNLALVDETYDVVELTGEDHEVLASLALPVPEALELASRHRERSCSLRDEQFTLSHEGKTLLCCAVFDSSRYGLGDFLEQPLEALHQAKYEHSLCSLCMKNGLHVYSVYGLPEFDDMAARSVSAEDARALDLAGERRRRRWQRGIIWATSLAKRTLPSPLYERLRTVWRRLRG